MLRYTYIANLIIAAYIPSEDVQFSYKYYILTHLVDYTTIHST
jgi:hypothetical protein